MHIPDLSQPRSGRRMEGKHVILFGAGTSNEAATSWSMRHPSNTALGVGRAAALVYARHGAHVVCVDRNIAAAQRTADMIHAQGGEAAAVFCEATDAGSVKATVDKILAEHDRIDVLHNNIGVAALGGAVESTEESFEEVMTINLKSMYLTCKYTLPIMEEQGRGVIVNISSVAATRYSLPWLSYNVSKGGVNSMTMAIAAQYARSGIRCNAIAPGMLSTPMVLSTQQRTFDDFKALMEGRDNAVPLGWQGEGWDVGEASVFLASDEARFITGHVLVVDGGNSVVMPSYP